MLYVLKISETYHQYMRPALHFWLSTFLTFHVGPVVPVAATNIESTVTSFSTVILAWTVPRVAYTPETYTVVYGTNQLSLDQRSDSVNGTSGTTHYSVELTQLQHSTQYYYQVESVNIAGFTQSDIADFEVQNACKKVTLAHRCMLFQCSDYYICVNCFLHSHYCLHH